MAAFDEVEHAYITDGHHRSKAAVVYSRGEGPSVHGGPRSPNVFTMLFADDHLKIVEFNRIVHDVRDPSPLQRTLTDWGARPVRREAARPPDLGRSSVWVSGFWYSVDLPTRSITRPTGLPRSCSTPGPPARPGARNRRSHLRSTPRVRPRIGGPGGSGAPGRTGAAFVLAPVALADMMSVSDAGGRMPPKSTYFEPKVRSGIFLVER